MIRRTSTGLCVSGCPVHLITLRSAHRFKNNFLQSDWIEDFVKLLNSSQRGFSVRYEDVHYTLPVWEHFLRGLFLSCTTLSTFQVLMSVGSDPRKPLVCCAAVFISAAAYTPSGMQIHTEHRNSR